MKANRILALSAVAMMMVGVACEDDNNATAPSLSLTCSSTPSSGTAPLTVSYGLNVVGAEGSFSVAIYYGDGTGGPDPDTTHTYTTPGVFTTSFTVRTSSQSARCTTQTTVAGTTAPPSSPTPDPSNAPPHAIFKSTPAAGSDDRIVGFAPFAVRFNMCASTDPEDNKLNFTMDLDGDGDNEVDGTTGGDCRHDRTYAGGTYTVENCVTDLGPNGAPLHAYQCKKWTVVAQ